MIVKRFFEPLIAQTSYLLGCAVAGEAVVIDPNRDIEQYIAAAERDGLRIAFVTETHIHADFCSGARELAHRTGARLCLSDEGDAEWKYKFAKDAGAELLKDGDRITIGNVRLDVVHTPGHTPEHLTFLITDGAVADKPIAAATGDFIFVGDVGRPDLLERAANMKGTMEKGAHTLWASMQAFKKREDWLQIWPGHGAGSSCGKGISAVPHSTLGYERLFNWALATKSENEFVANVLAGQPDPPKYFATMKRVNKEGPQILGGLKPPPRMPETDLVDILARGGLVIDARAASEYASGHVEGTLNIPFNGSFVTWAGWLIPYTEDFYVIVDDESPERLHAIRRALALIGLDRFAGYFTSGWIGRTIGRATIPQMTAGELAARLSKNGLVVLDVRNQNEWDEGHLPEALHIPLGHLSDRLSEVPRDTPIVVHCQAGARSAIAASLMEKLGRKGVTNLVGGYEAWQAR